MEKPCLTPSAEAMPSAEPFRMPPPASAGQQKAPPSITVDGASASISPAPVAEPRGHAGTGREQPKRTAGTVLPFHACMKKVDRGGRLGQAIACCHGRRRQKAPPHSRQGFPFRRPRERFAEKRRWQNLSRRKSPKDNCCRMTVACLRQAGQGASGGSLAVPAQPRMAPSSAASEQQKAPPSFSTEGGASAPAFFSCSEEGC